MEEVQKESPFAGMPLELVRAIVGKLDLDLDEDDDLSALFEMLLVSKAIKAMTEELHPWTLSYYWQCIAEHLVKHPSQVLAVEMTRSPALAQLDKLFIDFEEWTEPGKPHEFKDLMEGVVSDRRIESLNALMLLCPKLRTFTWDFKGVQVDRWDKMELWRSNSLRELQLCGIVPMNKGGALDLSNALTIESFTMTYDYGLDTVLSAPSPRLKLPPNVQRLELRLGMDVEALERLGIPGLPCLTDLILSGNAIGAEGVRHLQVGASQTLRKVSLGGAGGGNAIFEALGLDGSSTKLEALSLESNDITDPSLLHLERNTSLKRVSVASNPLTNLDFGLDRNPSLEFLNLRSIRGSSRARSHFQALSRQLAENTTLQRLMLSWSELTDDMLDGLELPASSGLQLLELQQNSISEATANRLSSHVAGLDVLWKSAFS